MEKLILITVLVAVAIVLVFAIKGKKFKNISIPEIPDIKNLKHITGIISWPKSNGLTGDNDNTVILPALHMHQLAPNKKNSLYYTHDITLDQMYSGDKMVGVSVSHPGANSNGIKLHGKRKKDGSYDKHDKATYAALTVNTNAIKIGTDEDGFYGWVTNRNAKVYIVNENNKTVAIQYDKTFDIKDKTCILIGHQWLYFTFPQIPSFPGMPIGDDESDFDTIPERNRTVDTFDAPVKPNQEMKRRCITATDTIDCRNIIKKPVSNEKKVDGKKVMYSFPLEED